MIPQITQRKIGNVKIIDIKGALSGSWALRGKEKLSQALASKTDEKVVFNLKETNSLDTLGAKSIFESIPQDREAGILFGNAGIADVINRFSESKRFQMFHNEAEIVSAFGQDFVSDENTNEQRTFLRMETAVPMEFYYEEEGRRVQFQAIITNLSEGGLFAEYIDLETAEESLLHLDPYELKTLHLKLLFPNKKPIHAEGKVVYRKLDAEQVGIGIQFSEIGQLEKNQIRHFLKLHSFEKTTLNQL